MRAFRIGLAWWPVMVLALVTAIVWGAQRPLAPGALPDAGHRVGVLVWQAMSARDEVMVVSDRCGACRARSEAILRWVAEDERRGLVVARVADSAFFEHAVNEMPHVAGQTVFVDPSALAAEVGVRVVPSQIELRPPGLVETAKVSRVGLWREIVDPAGWLQAWRRLLEREAGGA